MHVALPTTAPQGAMKPGLQGPGEMADRLWMTAAAAAAPGS